MKKSKYSALDWVKVLFFPLILLVGIIWYFTSKREFKKTPVKKGATISKSEAQSLADRLLIAFSNDEEIFGFGTNEGDIWNIFRKEINNGADFDMVYNAFGYKEYAFGGSFLFGTTLDLIGWLQAEMDTANEIIEVVKLKGLHTGVKSTILSS